MPDLALRRRSSVVKTRTTGRDQPIAGLDPGAIPLRLRPWTVVYASDGAGAAASWLIWGVATSSEPTGLRIDGSRLAGHVWEAVDPCRPLTGSDIGRWRCSIRYAGGSAPDWAPLQRDKQFRARIDDHLALSRA